MPGIQGMGRAGRVRLGQWLLDPAPGLGSAGVSLSRPVLTRPLAATGHSTGRGLLGRSKSKAAHVRSGGLAFVRSPVTPQTNAE